MPTSYSIVLIAAAIGIVPVFGWVWFIARRDGLTIGNLNLLVKVFFFGVLTAIPASIIEIYIVETQKESQIFDVMHRIWFHQETFLVMTTFVSALLVATIEEIAKALGILFSFAKKKLETSNDGMMYGMIIGLAFAVTENGVYFASAIQVETGMNFWGIVLLRFILSTSAHIIYSGLMGMFLVQARLHKRIVGKISYLMLGFLVPIIIHSVFNFMLGSAYDWVVVIIISCGFLIMWMRYVVVEKKRGIRI
jgi:protease PrsW